MSLFMEWAAEHPWQSFINFLTIISWIWIFLAITSWIWIAFNHSRVEKP